MIHHLVLLKLKPGTDDETIEQMMRETRIQLLKIPEVLSVRCGKCVDANQEWPFFVSIEVESRQKLACCMDDPIHVKFQADVLAAHAAAQVVLDFEMEPGRDVRYS